MSKARIEAFSDGVIAVIITIMVLELKVPREPQIEALRALSTTFASYLVSFVMVGIYWNNHHHLWHVAKHATAGAMWANHHLLFWLSLVPFVTAWWGQTDGAAWPTAIYGAVLLSAALAYVALQSIVLAQHEPGSPVRARFKNVRKELASTALYLSAIPLAFVRPRLAAALYVVVATIWLVPDRRAEP